MKMHSNTELSPLAAAIAEDILKYKMILPGDRIIVGLSGGPDSVCLLSVLAELRKVLEIDSLHAVHVNHGLRDEESDRDQAYAELLAGRLDATFDAVRCDVRKTAKEQGIGEEAAGRKIRYDIFERFRKHYHAQRIAVAHNRNDQAETVLMRLIRGTGLRGLSGIGRVRNDIVIRPLLDVPRDRIEQYCREKGFTPCVDSSNLKPVYTRNRIRLDLIPLIEKEYNPRLQDALIRLASQATETEDYLRQEAVRYLDEKEGINHSARWSHVGLYLNAEGFGKLHPALAGRVVMEMLERAGASEDVTSDTISRIIRTAQSETEPVEADLHHDYYVRKMYGKLWFLKRTPEGSEIIREPVPLPLEHLEETGTAEVKAGNILIRLSLSEKRGRFRSEQGLIYGALDLDRILSEGIPAFRNRRPGDRFRPMGMKGRKKIQDYFTDRKIPRQIRDQAVLLALGQEVFFVEGDVSGNCAVTEETQRILRIRYRR